MAWEWLGWSAPRRSTIHAEDFGLLTLTRPGVLRDSAWLPGAVRSLGAVLWCGVAVVIVVVAVVSAAALRQPTNAGLDKCSSRRGVGPTKALVANTFRRAGCRWFGGRVRGTANLLLCEPCSCLQAWPAAYVHGRAYNTAAEPEHAIIRDEQPDAAALPDLPNHPANSCLRCAALPRPLRDL